MRKVPTTTTDVNFQKLSELTALKIIQLLTPVRGQWDKPLPEELDQILFVNLNDTNCYQKLYDFFNLNLASTDLDANEYQRCIAQKLTLEFNPKTIEQVKLYFLFHASKHNPAIKNTPLITAIHNDDLDLISALMSARADADNFAQNHTPLSFAVYSKKHTALEIIIQHEYYLPNKNICYAIIEAVLINDIETLPKLLSRAQQAGLFNQPTNPLNIFFVEPDDNRSLHLAVIHKNKNIINLLIENGASPDQENKHGSTPLTLALKDKNVFFMIANHKNYNPNRNIKIAIFYIVQMDNLKMAKTLIQKAKTAGLLKKDLDDTFDLATQFFTQKLKLENAALYNGFINSIKETFDKTSRKHHLLNDITTEGKNNSLLHMAVEHQNFNMVELLTDNGADPDKTNADLMTPICFSIRTDQINIFKFMVTHENYHPTINIACSILAAVDKNDYEIAETLILKANKHQLLNDGLLNKIYYGEEDSLLHLARKVYLTSESPNINIIKLLVKFGADPKKKNKKGDSALSLAYKNKNLEILEAFAPSTVLTQQSTTENKATEQPPTQNTESSQQQNTDAPPTHSTETESTQLQNTQDVRLVGSKPKKMVTFSEDTIDNKSAAFMENQ